jgi:signal transduction histidine kinase
MTELIDLTFDSLQKLCSELRPALLDDFGLVPAIEWRLEEFQKHSDIRCSFSTNCEDINLHSDQVICLFRIFQEALTNVIRHANATEISVSFLLKAQSNSLELKIRDDGKGITWEQISSLKSFGLIGMRERLHPFNGRLEIMGIPDEGTILTAILPLREGEVVK